jgi:hypothetical protein
MRLASSALHRREFWAQGARELGPRSCTSGNNEQSACGQPGPGASLDRDNANPAPILSCRETIPQLRKPYRNKETVAPRLIGDCARVLGRDQDSCPKRIR